MCYFTYDTISRIVITKFSYIFFFEHEFFIQFFFPIIFDGMIFSSTQQYILLQWISIRFPVYLCTYLSVFIYSILLFLGFLGFLELFLYFCPNLALPSSKRWLSSNLTSRSRVFLSPNNFLFGKKCLRARMSYVSYCAHRRDRNVCACTCVSDWNEKENVKWNSCVS